MIRAAVLVIECDRCEAETPVFPAAFSDQTLQGLRAGTVALATAAQEAAGTFPDWCRWVVDAAGGALCPRCARRDPT